MEKIIRGNANYYLIAKTKSMKDICIVEKSTRTSTKQIFHNLQKNFDTTSQYKISK